MDCNAVSNNAPISKSSDFRSAHFELDPYSLHAMNSTVSLGNAEISTARLGLGCARLGSILTPLNRAQSCALLETAYRLGIRHFDTANIYGQGDSERYLGEVFKSRRQEICIATKAGQRLSRHQTLLAPFKTPLRLLAQHGRPMRKSIAEQRSAGLDYSFNMSDIAASLEESLRRLRTDYVDIFYLHAPKADVLRDAPFEQLAEKLLREGKIRSFGVSCDDLSAAHMALTLPYVQVVQFEAGSESSEQIVSHASGRGKALVVRGVARLVQGAEAHGDYAHALIRSLSALLLEKAHAVLIGTTNVQHLADNVAAFKRAQSLALMRAAH